MSLHLHGDGGGEVGACFRQIDPMSVAEKKESNQVICGGISWSLF